MNPIIEVIATRLLGPAVMVAAAIIVKGYTDVGDGFSAGVIVALAIALRYITLGPDVAERSLPVLRKAPVVAAGGLLIALGFGFGGVVVGDPPFTHYPGPGEDVITPPGRSKLPVSTFRTAAIQAVAVPNSTVWLPIRP